RYEEDPRPGRFDAARARALGIPEGPVRAALQRGETVAVHGRSVRPEAVVGPPRPGRRFAYVVDTVPCDGAAALLEGCDLAVVEAMFREEHAAEAAAKMHLTARQAAHLARRAGVKRLLLTHFSPRYGAAEIVALEAEAREIEETAAAARPLGRYPIPFPS
ncbi:MAG: ribonuclease Z, partial [Planctomycetes bacterium]|nr:ribonuclease Z [Planctomycetota bacterium]